MTSADQINDLTRYRPAYAGRPEVLERLDWLIAVTELSDADAVVDARARVLAALA